MKQYDEKVYARANINSADYVDCHISAMRMKKLITESFNTTLIELRKSLLTKKNSIKERSERELMC